MYEDIKWAHIIESTFSVNVHDADAIMSVRTLRENYPIWESLASDDLEGIFNHVGFITEYDDSGLLIITGLTKWTMRDRLLMYHLLEATGSYGQTIEVMAGQAHWKWVMHDGWVETQLAKPDWSNSSVIVRELLEHKDIAVLLGMSEKLDRKIEEKLKGD